MEAMTDFVIKFKTQIVNQFQRQVSKQLVGGVIVVLEIQPKFCGKSMAL